MRLRRLRNIPASTSSAACCETSLNGQLDAPASLVCAIGNGNQRASSGSGCRWQRRNLTTNRRHLLRTLTQALPSRIPAASSGTMNNLTIGGLDDRGGAALSFAYYETIAGGSGASAVRDGVSGVHTHMTNSLNTPAEALEYSYPIRVTRIPFAGQRWCGSTSGRRRSGARD